jgi:thioredoxin-related protein
MKRGVTGGEWRVARKIMIALAGLSLLCGCNQNAVAADQPNIWQSNYDAALKQAAAENKYMLVSISGMEWCGWCIRLEDEVFSKPEFISYAKDNLICVLLDFPRGKELPKAQKDANQALLEKFQVQGFPTVLIFNPQGKGIVRDGYRPGGPAKYVEFIKTAITADKSK